jgi:DNA-binding transcriptional MerR regulator
VARKTALFSSGLRLDEGFTSKAASRIAGVSLRQIQYWDERGFVRPSIRLPEGRGTRRLYSFGDLVQLKVMRELARHGLAPRKLRRCLDRLRPHLERADSSGASLRYVTDGEKLFLLTGDRSKVLEALEGDFVFSLKVGPLVREIGLEARRMRARRRPAGGTKAGSAGRSVRRWKRSN